MTQHLLVACTAALLATFALPTAAQNAVTVYAGARAGGSGFSDSAAGDRSLDLEGGGAGSISFDWAIDPSRQVQIFLSRQSTELRGVSTSGGGSDVVPLDISYAHLGGTVFFENGLAQQGGYVVGGLGVSHLSPGLDGLSAEIRPSMSIGIGYEMPLASALALRLELRGYATLVNSDSSFFCSGGCTVNIKGDIITQAEVMLGLSVRF
jgi:Outer membrane protein beta-barrel domain